MGSPAAGTAGSTSLLRTVAHHVVALVIVAVAMLPALSLPVTAGEPNDQVPPVPVAVKVAAPPSSTK